MDNSSALSSGNFYSSETQDCPFGSLRIIWVRNAGYQRLRQLAEDARVLGGIRQGIEDMNAGRTVSLDEFKEHTGTKHGIRM